ncbi:hypothetical protein [Azospirillum lipoferum]|uniref:Uncharacterized protein n=1 Tax=Azospirillum lipoferum (strain 4B) TaxID=862719 RepID=G7ZAU1_AZOL4|nr:hypothetical protein [Azospirillum lipoferum]CBS89001.1 protein of unknown function [Azospirillum lipoferum 4B]
MTTITNAPTGANAPATPITWTTRHLPGPGGGSVIISTAQAGPYALEVHDSQSRSGWPRIVLWTVEKDGKRLGEGVLDTTDDGKAAAESKARRLLTDTPSDPNNNGAGSRVIPACVNGMPKRGVRPGAHLDSELLFAWDAFQAAATAYQCAPDGETDRYCEMVDAIGERIEAFIPKTLEGTEIKLRYALTKYIDADCAWNALVFGDDPDRDFHDIVDNDPHAGMLWSMIRPGDRLVDRIDRRRREQPAKGPDHSSSPSA